ncbi:MAG: hypothetical protein WKF37_13400 [Bryobacteraceae bacterium]
MFQDATSSNLIRFLDERAPGLAASLAERPHAGLRSFEHFLEKVFINPHQLLLLNRNRRLAWDTLDLFESSPHFAEELIRHPALIDELAEIRNPENSNYSDLIAKVGRRCRIASFLPPQMLGIQAQSICLGAEIFHTLGRTSDLADAVIGSAYSFARDQVAQSNATVDPDYRPLDQMMVIALGRLGMREFDLGSDADLNFVLPDQDASELQFWTRVAERMIDILTAYTGEGIMFTVDTRLRPNGRAGTLVQTVSTYVDYLARSAEAWEGITYMKSRAVAGNVATATSFLHRLQEVDWQRYGQSGRSRSDLRNMRVRLERNRAPLIL